MRDPIKGVLYTKQKAIRMKKELNLARYVQEQEAKHVTE